MANNLNINFTPYQTIIPSTWLNNVNQVVNDVVPVSLLAYGCACDGVTDDTSKVLSAISLIGTTVTTLIIPSKTKISSNITFGANTTLVFWEGGGFVGAAGTEVITFYQPIQAARFSIFQTCQPIAGVGMVVYPEWFGAVRDGVTNDAAAFATAFACLANGGVVQMSAGTYAIRNITVPSGVTLLGLGSNTILQPDAGFSASGILITIAAGASHVELGNFQCNVNEITYNASSVIYGNPSASYVYVHDIFMPHAGQFGINWHGFTHSRISRLTILAGQTIGVSVASGTYNVIEDSYVTGIIGSHHFQLTSENQSIIRGCQSYLLTGSGFGMNCNQCGRCRIEDCITQDSAAEGINLTDSNQCVVTDNTCFWTGTQSQDFGMSLNAASVSCNQNIVSNNHISFSGKSGIALAASSATCLGNSVIGNTVVNSGLLNLPYDGGILIYQGSTGTASNNLIEGNLIYGDGTHTKYGVLESSAYGGTPNGQRIALNLVAGITVANVQTVGAQTVSFVPTNW